ncbi:hypothetical protein GCM10025865_19840 [Paraoerskovia sediminicola]|uniref:Polyketide cyclase / dehydrase and lipid transport n=1 Tax=Paraoerskovia sediminicola TaxID=1138587 RepID=A0ABM8G3H3_9CELL|nr:hypothetical protein GCM10025865_19840 [Paraoerskovia sediminicola]
MSDMDEDRREGTRDEPLRAVTERRELDVPADVAFSWVADWRTHPRWIPLTRAESGSHRWTTTSRTAPRPGGGPEGETFTMVSGPWATRGAPGFVDRMVTVRAGELRRPTLAPELPPAVPGPRRATGNRRRGGRPAPS